MLIVFSRHTNGGACGTMFVHLFVQLLATLLYQFGLPVTPIPHKQGYGTDCTPNSCIANCAHTTSVSGMVTTDSLQELTNAIYSSTITNPLRTHVLPNMGPYPQNLHGALWPSCISGMVTINGLQTFTNALSNASIADLPLPHQTVVLGLQIAAKPLQIGHMVTVDSLQVLTNAHPTVHSLTLTDTCSPKIGVPTPIPPKCMLPGRTVGYPSDTWAFCYFIVHMYCIVL